MKDGIINVMIVGHSEKLREDFKKRISVFENMIVVAVANNDPEAYYLLEKIVPDILFVEVLDISMKETEHIIKKSPNLKVIAIGNKPTDLDIQKMENINVNGFVTNLISDNELEDGIIRVFKGEIFYSFEVLLIINQFMRRNYINVLFNLKTREREILKFIVEGLTNSQIKKKLFISLRTIEGHKCNLFRKTGTKNIAELKLFSIENKLFD